MFTQEQVWDAINIFLTSTPYFQTISNKVLLSVALDQYSYSYLLWEYVLESLYCSVPL